MEIYRGNVSLRSLKLTGQILAADGSAAAPSISFSGDPDTGVYRHAANETGIATGGVARGIFYSAGLSLGTGHLVFGSAIDGGLDTILTRDAANVLAQRNGTTAQGFNIYNTYTSASVYEVGFMKWGSNVFQIGTTKSGGGSSARIMAFYTDGVARWYIDTSGHLVANTDNTYDIGASGATRPRSFYFATSIIGPGTNPASAGAIRLADTYQVTWRNAANTSDHGLQFVSDVFSINFSSTQRVAITSGGAPNFCAGVATPAGGNTAVRLVMGSTAGFGIYIGSGVPTVSAAQGSLYLRSDGSSTTTRAYINTDGGTTWTAISTVA